LVKANDQLAIQYKQQLEHFACMLHKIQTPLTCIARLSFLMLESPAEELMASLAGLIQMISTSADLPNAVTNNVLDYLKMESASLGVDICPKNLQKTLNNIVDTMEEKDAQKHVQIPAHYASQCCQNMPKYTPNDFNKFCIIYWATSSSFQRAVDLWI
jgi:signal transduction histidine kinase